MASLNSVPPSLNPPSLGLTSKNLGPENSRITSCLSLCSWTTVLPEGLEECEPELRHVPLSLGLCLQRQRGPTGGGTAEMEAARVHTALARSSPLSSHGSTSRQGSGSSRPDTARLRSRDLSLILRLAPEVRAQDARRECEVTPRYLRLGCCHPVSRPGGDKARFPDESGSASQPWCQSNLPTRLETNLPPAPPRFYQRGRSGRSMQSPGV